MIKEKYHKVAAIYNDELDYSGNDYLYDEYLESFVLGCNGKLSTWDREKNTDVPLVIRGVGKAAKEAFQHCWKTGRDFYCIDTGYFGNEKSKSKGWHRITKNNLQNLGPIVERPGDRLKKVGYKFKKFTKGSKILICPPSEKVMSIWNQPLPKEWVELVTEELKQYTDRPIEIRMKPDRYERVTTNTIEDALRDDVYCLITYNSIAATEALINGKPAIALGPNAASVLCNQSLEDIENLYIPSKDEVDAFVRHLSYCQFTRREMQDGTAWRILNESS